MAYIVPQALVFQEFEVAPDVVANTQKACLIGPRKSLIRYSVADEKLQGLLGAYDSLVDADYLWPNRATGDEVDDASVRLFIDDALLQYFNNPATGGTGNAQATLNSTTLQDLVVGTADTDNIVRASTLVFDGANRTADIPTDVEVGDAVRVAASVGGDVVELITSIEGFLPEKVASTIDTATEDENNISYISESGSSSAPGLTASAGNAAAETLTITGTAADASAAFADGVGSDSYVLTVVEGGEYDTAVFSLVSASGTDTVAAFSLTEGGSIGDTEEIGTKGLTIDFAWVGSAETPEFVTGQIWNLDAVFPTGDTDVVEGGDYTGSEDTTYIVTVTTGAEFGGASNPKVTVSTTTGIDFSGPHEVVEGADLAIGTKGVTVNFSGDGLYLGDRFYVPVTAEASGDNQTIILADSLPTALTELDGLSPRELSLTFYVQKNIEVPRNRTGYAPLTNFDTTATQITVNSGIIANDARITSDGDLVDLNVRGGAVYVEYAATVRTGVGVVNAATDVGVLSTQDAVETNLGTVDPANPLAYGVYKALSNVSGGEVMYIATAGDTLADYLDALAVLSQRDDVYSLVPLTYDRNVQDAVAAHVQNMSGEEVGKWRICWVCRPAIETKAIVGEDDTVLATLLDDGATSGTQYTRLDITSGNAHLIDDGVQPGDVVRAQYSSDGFGSITYSEYIVDAVLSPTQLRLASGPAAEVSVPSKVEIWRTLTSTQVASETGENIGTFGSRRVYCVWPDTVEVAGESVPGYYLAAALAGLKSSVLPQQSLTNVNVAGFDGVSRTVNLFDNAQLNTLAESGTTIVTQSATGQIYVRHSLSTDNADLNMRELMRTTNVDSISYVMLSRVANYQGKYNITDGLLERIRLSLTEAIDELQIVTGSESVGPQVLGLREDIEVVRSDIYLDRVIATIRPDLPYPNNNTEVHIVI